MPVGDPPNPFETLTLANNNHTAVSVSGTGINFSDSYVSVGDTVQSALDKMTKPIQGEAKEISKEICWLCMRRYFTSHGYPESLEQNLLHDFEKDWARGRKHCWALTVEDGEPMLLKKETMVEDCPYFTEHTVNRGA